MKNAGNKMEFKLRYMKDLGAYQVLRRMYYSHYFAKQGFLSHQKDCLKWLLSTKQLVLFIWQQVVRMIALLCTVLASFPHQQKGLREVDALTE